MTNGKGGWRAVKEQERRDCEDCGKPVDKYGRCRRCEYRKRKDGDIAPAMLAETRRDSVMHMKRSIGERLRWGRDNGFLQNE